MCVKEREGASLRVSKKRLLCKLITANSHCFLGKPTRKIVNGDLMIMGHLATCHKCKRVAKCPDCNHRTVCVWDVLHLSKAITRLNNC